MISTILADTPTTQSFSVTGLPVVLIIVGISVVLSGIGVLIGRARPKVRLA